MSDADYTSEVIVARGEQIYQQFRNELEPQYKGQFFVVDIKMEDYEIADEDLVATERLLTKHPDAVTYGLQIGFGAAYRLGFRISVPTQ